MKQKVIGSLREMIKKKLYVNNLKSYWKIKLCIEWWYIFGLTHTGGGNHQTQILQEELSKE